METGGTKVCTQNLRDFTVKIFNSQTKAVAGTGFVVSADGKIVTCAHVVLAAGVNPRTQKEIPGHWAFIVKSLFGPVTVRADPAEAVVGVYFPQVGDRPSRNRKANVLAIFPNHDDDIVLLQLVGDSPLGPDQFARLGQAKDSENHPFNSYGYSSLGNKPATRAGGTIDGLVEPPEGLNVQRDPIQLHSDQIDRGMSGAAVLDIEPDRNLVVGIVCETWYPDNALKHAATAWAVDADILSLFGLTLASEGVPMKDGPQPRLDLEPNLPASPASGSAWHNAPPPLVEWVGREDLLRKLNADWADEGRRVTGLIGFGGEGKSSLARRWVDDLLRGPPENRPAAVFWWGFYTSAHVEKFFEEALLFLGGETNLADKFTSASARAHLVAAMLEQKRFLFVLDGLEVMQATDGDRYGLLRRDELREFIKWFASPRHRSFCLITSRAPVLDLIDFTTYRHRDVDRLSPADGQALLRKVGVGGPDEELERVVADWDGHALTLGLLGAYLVEQHGGDVSHLAELPVPTTKETPYERVHRLLRRYDEQLTEAGRAFLKIFSAFRGAVTQAAIDHVFRHDLGANALNAPLVGMTADSFSALVGNLVSRRILRYDPEKREYTDHVLIHAHYSESLRQTEAGKVQAIHIRIMDYYSSIKDSYLSTHRGTRSFPSLSDLTPRIEAVHHACLGCDFDAGYRFYRLQLEREEEGILSWALNAYEVVAALMEAFFPGGDASKDPQVSDPEGQRYIVNKLGVCRMNLGRLPEAPQFYRRAIDLALKSGNHLKAAHGYENLAELYSYLGPLADSTNAAERALEVVRPLGDKEEERDCLAYRAWAAHLRGELDQATKDFAAAEKIQGELDANRPFLWTMYGVWHADHLRRIGRTADARQITEANLKLSRAKHKIDDISQCHRVLGDLDAAEGQHGSARKRYDEALRVVRGITERTVLLEALLARGRWAARQRDVGLARNDLEEALDHALAGSYRVYEADVRIALAWVHLAEANKTLAETETQRAEELSESLGYYWGQVDAKEVRSALQIH